MIGYSICFSADGDVAEVEFRDRFAPSTVMAVILEIKQDPRYASLSGVLWDLSAADLSALTIESLREIFATQKAVYPSKTLRVACVISSESDAYILKLWAEGFNDARPNQRRWFFDSAEARAWLRLDSDPTSGRRRPGSQVIAFDGDSTEQRRCETFGATANRYPLRSFRNGQPPFQHDHGWDAGIVERPGAFGAGAWTVVDRLPISDQAART